MLTLLTATGCRPKAWAICEKLMLAQNYDGAVRWVIVDDGEEMQPVTFQRDNWTLDIVRPQHRWKEGMNTQAANLLAGLEVISNDARLVILEDDDNYAPDWLKVVDKHLDNAELVGEILARYYNIATKTGRQLNNTQHASLCATAMRGDAIEAFRKVCIPNTKFIDINLWKNHKNKLLFTGNRVVGIKGFEGRAGIGMGHKPDFNGIKDKDGSLLKEWIGESIKHYGVNQ
jgi:hypothetical protein